MIATTSNNYFYNLPSEVIFMQLDGEDFYNKNNFINDLLINKHYKQSCCELFILLLWHYECG